MSEEVYNLGIYSPLFFYGNIVEIYFKKNTPSYFLNNYTSEDKFEDKKYHVKIIDHEENIVEYPKLIENDISSDMWKNILKAIEIEAMKYCGDIVKLNDKGEILSVVKSYFELVKEKNSK